MFNLDFDGAVYAVNSESSVVPSPVSTKAFMSVSISLMLVMVMMMVLVVLQLRQYRQLQNQSS